jgi:hypothetical protein
MDEGDRLIQRLDGSRNTMNRALTFIDKGLEIYPEWTIREILIHIAGWDEVGTSTLRAHIAGEPPAPIEIQDIDTYNSYLVSSHEALTLEEVIRYWRRARREMVDALEQMPPEKFQERARFPWGETGTITRLVSILDEHEREHAAEILEMLSPGTDEEDD